MFKYFIQHLINTLKSERGGGGGATTTTSHTYYYYKIKLAHNSIDPSQSIIFYDTFGTILYTMPPYDSNMDYASGTVSVPGTEQNTQVESVSTATYYVFYSTDDIVIDYENAEFKIAKKLIRAPAQTVVKGTFEYLSVITAFRDIASVIDGRYDTQVQTEFFAQPPSGYNYSIIDLGSVKTVQAIDIIAGFYKPDEYRKFDISFNASLQYSINGTDYYDISDKTHNFSMSGGEGKSFEEEDLGTGFTARYLKMVLESVKRVDYGQTKDAEGNVLREGVYVVALTEVSAYDNIVITSNVTLIPRTLLSADVVIQSADVSGTYPTTVTVESTEGFSSSGTAYILNSDGTYDAFNYTSVTATKFMGVSGLNDYHEIGDAVVQTIEGDTSLYDYDTIRPKLGDRIYKTNKVSDSSLFTQAQLDYVAKAYLREFVKNHTKIQVDVLYSPHIQIGDTIKVVDDFNGISQNYFVESIKDNNGFYTLTLAYYPA
jgi:hypothetical protein